MTRLFFCAGESSGDLHGANLIAALRARDPSIECEGLGGTKMRDAGMVLREDLAGTAIMGFVEVIRSLNYIRKIFTDTVAHLKQSPPDALVLIDYPGFNIRLAKKGKALGIPVIYYISPQIWAWKKGRIHTLAHTLEKMLVILPFEKQLYEEVGLDCTYVGHPSIDHVDGFEFNDTYAGQTVIGILPGSREQEIRRHLPVMLEVARGIREKHPDSRFVAPCVDEDRARQIREAAPNFPLEVETGGMNEVLHAARFCLVSSGTATVETALFGVPMIVMYKMSPITYWLARLLVRVEAIALANILAGKHIVPEYIQHEANATRILPDALELIDDSPRRAGMLDDLKTVRAALAGGASDNAAREILAVVGGPGSA